MKTLTQPLRDEHKELLPHLDHILGLADEIAEGANPTLVERVGKIHRFLADDLLHHAHIEEEALYPVVADVLGAPEATATMSRDHVEIGRLVEELGVAKDQLVAGSISRRQANELRRLLYGLHAIVKLHFLKEEEVYLPLLDARLTEAGGAALLEAIERASAGA
ncbi:MAG: hemerythrin domain-containing protein [Longimicrobiales bacterium]